MLGVAKSVLAAGAVAIPVLNLGGAGRCGHLQVGQHEDVGVDRIGMLEILDRQRALVGVCEKPDFSSFVCTGSWVQHVRNGNRTAC